MSVCPLKSPGDDKHGQGFPAREPDRRSGGVAAAVHPLPVGKLEAADHVAQMRGLVGETGRGGIGALHHGDVLLGDVIERAERAVDGVEAGRLLAACPCNGVHQLVDRHDVAADRVERVARIADMGDAAGDSRDEFSISALISRAASAERPASARTSCATTAKPLPHHRHGRPRRRRERQQVRLEGDFVNDADDIGDLGGGFLDAAHRLFGIGDDRAGLAGAVIRLRATVRASATRLAEEATCWVI